MMNLKQYFDSINKRYKLGLEFVEETTTPLNLPKGETLTFSLEDTEQVFSPPLEGPGEVIKPGYITANPINYKLIKVMRDALKVNPTEAEKVIWEYLRNKKTGHKIRRQHIIDDFITDFVCLIKKIVIEIDGEIHLQQKEYDELRTARLNELGYEVIRFTNEEVFANPELVTSQIKEILDKTPLNLPKGETLTFSLEDTEQVFSPPLEGPGEVDILDYFYAVLHSPKYQETYNNFPKVPYPKDKDTFWQLVKLGREIREREHTDI